MYAFSRNICRHPDAGAMSDAANSCRDDQRYFGAVSSAAVGNEKISKLGH